MSLNFNLTKIKDHDVICWRDGKMVGSTEAMIYMTMAVGIGEITSDNYLEFAARLELWQDVFGACFCGDVRLTVEDVKRHIGLRTNVFPKESWAIFFKKLRFEAERRVGNSLREAV